MPPVQRQFCPCVHMSQKSLVVMPPGSLYDGRECCIEICSYPDLTSPFNIILYVVLFVFISDTKVWGYCETIKHKLLKFNVLHILIKNPLKSHRPYFFTPYFLTNPVLSTIPFPSLIHLNLLSPSHFQQLLYEPLQTWLS